VQSYTRLEGKGRNDSYLLIRDEGRKWVLRLRSRSFLQVVSRNSCLIVLKNSIGAWGVVQE